MSQASDAKNLRKWKDVFDFKIYPNTIEPRLPFLRPGTKINRIPMNFLLQHGGMGDYICWCIALQWLTKNAPWIDGRVWAPQYFIEFARYLFDDEPGWKVYLIDDFNKLAEHKSLIRASSDDKPQLLNATGASLLNIGFAYFVNHCPHPTDIKYPELKLFPKDIPKELKGKEKQYAVFTPGGTTHARLVRGRHINPLIDDCKRRGLLPVVLGKHHLNDIHASFFDEGINWDGVLDLREKTTLFQAAATMKHAAYTMGLDNGLVHLAACTDASIVAGYNIEHPDRRRPIRAKGKWQEVTLTQKELACVFCETNMKSICNHNFKNCFYEEQDRKEAEAKGETYDSPKCIDMLFENQASRWIAAIDRIMREEKADSDIKTFVEQVSASAA